LEAKLFSFELLAATEDPFVFVDLCWGITISFFTFSCRYVNLGEKEKSFALSVVDEILNLMVKEGSTGMEIQMILNFWFSNVKLPVFESTLLNVYPSGTSPNNFAKPLTSPFSIVNSASIVFPGSIELGIVCVIPIFWAFNKNGNRIARINCLNMFYNYLKLIVFLILSKIAQNFFSILI
jgi:hypothetical protein